MYNKLQYIETASCDYDTCLLYCRFFDSFVHNVFDLILHTVKLQFQQVPQGGAIPHHKLYLRFNRKT